MPKAFTDPLHKIEDFTCHLKSHKDINHVAGVQIRQERSSFRQKMQIWDHFKDLEPQQVDFSEAPNPQSDLRMCSFWLFPSSYSSLSKFDIILHTGTYLGRHSGSKKKLCQIKMSTFQNTEIWSLYWLFFLGEVRKTILEVNWDFGLL